MTYVYIYNIYLRTNRAHQVRKVAQVFPVSRDRQGRLAAQDPEDNMEKRECQELMEHEESMEILERRET